MSETDLLIPINLKDEVNSHTTLSSLQSFWNVLWLTIIETFTLLTFIIFQFSIRTNSSHEADDHNYFIIYTVPCAINIVVSIIVFLAPRGHTLINRIYFITLTSTFLVGCCGIYFSIYEYLKESKSADCEERELKRWNQRAVGSLFFALTIWITIVRMAYAYGAFKLSRQPHVIADKYHAHEPDLRRWHKAIHLANSFIAVMAMPVCCRGLKGKDAHQAQHVVQLIYELIILVAAIIEAKYIELFSICIGLLGSVCGVTKFFEMEMNFNTAAIILSSILLGTDISNVHCIEINARVWVYLLTFSLIANIIRLKSIMHAYVERIEQLWGWLDHQREWIRQSSPTPLILSVKSPMEILQYPAHEGGNHHSKNPKEFYITLFMILFGLFLIVASSSMMGIGLSHYGSNHKASQFKSWEEANCILNGAEIAYGPYDGRRVLVSVSVALKGETNLTKGLAAIPLQERFRDDSYEEAVELEEHFLSKQSYPCRVPTKTISISEASVILASNSDPYLIILGSSQEISNWVAKFYIFLLIPLFGLVVGVGLIIASFVYATYNTRIRRREKARQQNKPIPEDIPAEIAASGVENVAELQ